MPYGRIYLVTNQVNNKRYIGQTIKSLDERFKGHVNSARQGGNSPIHCAIRKHGPINFTINLLEECASATELNDQEMHWIKHFNTFHSNDYNATLGGAGASGYTASPETRKKLSEMFRKERNPFWGKTHTSETRRKISRANKGRTVSQSLRQHLSQVMMGKNKGHKHSALALVNMSQGQQGNRNAAGKRSDEQRDRMSMGRAIARSLKSIATMLDLDSTEYTYDKRWKANSRD